MKNVIRNLFLLFIFAFVVNSCEDNTPVENNNPTSTDIIAQDLTITGKLITLKSTSVGKQVIDWNNGAGEMKVYLGGDLISTGTVAADGSFSVVLPGKMNPKYLTRYESPNEAVTVSPDSLQITQVGPLFKFFSPGGIQIPIQVKLFKDDNVTKLEEYEYQYVDIPGTVMGTHIVSVEETNKYSLTYSKGWNIKRIYDDELNKKNFTIISSLPANVLWFGNYN